MRPCIKNLAQIISLYSDINKIDTILITGGMAKADIIRNEFTKNLQKKEVYFTEIDGFLSVVGIIFSEWKKLRSK